ncbi:MAG: hypothetical protein V1826_01075 [bacterium]
MQRLFTPETSVVADGWSGRFVEEFQLSWIVSPGMLGGDAFTELFLTTASGNIYRIGEPIRRDCDVALRTWEIMNSERQRGKGYDAQGHPISREEAKKLILKVGAPLVWSRGNTTSLTAILAVNASRIYFSGLNDPPTSLRHEFWERVFQGQECPYFAPIGWKPPVATKG